MQKDVEISCGKITRLRTKLDSPHYPTGSNLSAVLVLIMSTGRMPSVILTKRVEKLKRHGGEISFPGGERENGETPLKTALREASEEIGIDPSGVEILGALKPVKTLTSNFIIVPVVGILNKAVQYRKNWEVEEIIEFPLSPREWSYREEPIIGPVFYYKSYRVWGATARILKELLKILGILKDL